MAQNSIKISGGQNIVVFCNATTEFNPLLLFFHQLQQKNFLAQYSSSTAAAAPPVADSEEAPALASLLESPVTSSMEEPRPRIASVKALGCPLSLGGFLLVCMEGTHAYRTKGVKSI
jgi:hypothetical protein